MDFSKAYDSIKREKVIEAMKEMKMSPNLIDFIQRIYSEDRTMIDMTGKRIWIDVKSGIKQGCTASPVIFKLITFKIIKEMRRRTKGLKIGERAGR